MGNELTLSEMADHLRSQSPARTLRMIHRIALMKASNAESRAKDHFFPRVLTARSGHLVGSIRATPKKAKGGVNIQLAAGGGRQDVKYAKVHEQGGREGTFFTIRPKRGKYLVFPVSADAFTGAGVARGGGAGSSWRSVEEVRIPSRPFLRPAFKEMEEDFMDAVSQLITNEVLVRG